MYLVSVPLESCWFTVGVFKDVHPYGVKHGSGTPAVEERQQPSQLSRGVHRSGMDGKESVTHVVHHGTQVLHHLLGHLGQMVEERRDVSVPVILSGIRGNPWEDLVSVATQVVAVSKDVCGQRMWRCGFISQHTHRTEHDITKLVTTQCCSWWFVGGKSNAVKTSE